jgi:hypothetical protein
MRERRCNETVTGVAGVKDAIMKGRAAARRNVMLDSDPIVISSIHRDDENASITSAITSDSVEESAVSIDVESLRDEMSVGTAVEHAVQTCSVQSVVNTFKTHYDSEYLWDNEDFCILIYTLQFTTERVGAEMNPRDLGHIKSGEYPTFKECDAKREPLPDGLTTEKIKAEVEAMFTTETSQVMIPRISEHLTDEFCDGCGHRFHKQELCTNMKKVVVDGKSKILFCDSVWTLLWWRHGRDAIVRKLDRALANGCLRHWRNLPYAGWYIDET